MTLREKKEAIIGFIKENMFLAVLFLVATLIFIYQHFSVLSWDFSSYVLNAKYLFYGGSYFESLRPPMAPVLLGVLNIFGVFGEYLYIIFVSLLFFYANIKLSDFVFSKFYEKNKIEKEHVRLIFYFFSLSSFVLLYGLAAGTELLCLAFLELFLLQVLTGKISGHYFAFAFLTRYAMLIFAPLLLFNKSIKRILINLGLVLLLIFPWLLFNYIKFGNWFASIVDAYANNVLLRDYLYQSLNWADVWFAIGWFAPFFALGLAYAVYSIIKNRESWFDRNKTYLLFIIVFLAILWDYSGIPLKQVRYLFNLTLPAAFFSSLGVLFLVSALKRKIVKKIVISLVLIAFLITANFSIIEIYGYSHNSGKFNSAAGDIRRLGIENCEILSPSWVMVAYFTENVYALGANDIPSVLNRSKIVLIFKDEITIDDRFNLSDVQEMKKLYENKDYLFLVGDSFSIENCSRKYVYDAPYVMNHCEIIAGKFRKLGMEGAVLKSCNLVNFK